MMNYVIHLSLLLLVWGSLFAQTGNDSAHYEVLPVITMQEQPLVEGTINGQPAYFLLDTGSEISLIHEPYARHYGFATVAVLNAVLPSSG